MTTFSLPAIYPILDAGLLQHAGIDLFEFALSLKAAGVRFLQYRDKDSSNAVVLERACRLRSIFPAGQATLILNDRVQLCATTGFDGVHVGQDDLSPADARSILGDEGILGLSTHNASQLSAASHAPVDYVAVGPVFGTTSKHNPDPTVGVEGVAAARSAVAKPLVAIGGITLENARSVFHAGADSVALISGLLPSSGKSTGKVLEDFRALIG